MVEACIGDFKGADWCFVVAMHLGGLPWDATPCHSRTFLFVAKYLMVPAQPLTYINLNISDGTAPRELATTVRFIYGGLKSTVHDQACPQIMDWYESATLFFTNEATWPKFAQLHPSMKSAW